MNRLITITLRIDPGVKHGNDAIEVIGLRDAGHDDICDDNAKDQRDELPGDSREQGQCDESDGKDDRRAQIGLAVDQDQGNDGGHEHDDDEAASAHYPIHAHLHDGSHGHEHGDLGEFGRLQIETGDDDGTLGTQGAYAHAKRGQREHGNGGEPEGDEDNRLSPEGIGNTAADDAQDETEGKEDRLALDVVRGVTELVIGRYRRGGLDHDDAEYAQCDNAQNEKQARCHDGRWLREQARGACSGLRLGCYLLACHDAPMPASSGKRTP